MSRTWIAISFLGAGFVSGIAFLAISNETVIPMVASGAGPGGVKVTSSGWLALAASLFSTGGFTLAGIFTAIANSFGWSLAGGSPQSMVAEITELTTSFAALMRDKSNRANQRRFVFALVDAAQMIHGCETSHEAGVIVVRYRGYADPIAETATGSAPPKA